jgi:hypothetical protein
MTKDEAKQRCASLLGAMDKGLPSDLRVALLVDGFVCLGMLKLDEPNNAWAKFSEVLVKEFGYSAAEHCKSTTLHSIKEALSLAGLKIVEK